MATRYSHFCPAARALEKIGDKWSLLIVRDLLEGPKRFTDLLAYLNNITPKWLTLRLRELEAAGIVKRDCQSGRREVWYRLTPAGGDLSPIIEGLVSWGQRYAMRPPLPGEVVNSERLMKGLAKWLNKRGKLLSHPAVYSIRFPQCTYLLSFAGDEWTSTAGEAPDADIKINTTPETMATFTTVPRKECGEIFESMRVMGMPNQINEFRKIFGVPNSDAKQIHKQNTKEK
jgi:DNA-binding HxlR family transcriptional regulator